MALHLATTYQFGSPTYACLGAISFYAKVGGIFTVAVYTAASPVWVRKGSHTYQRGGV